MMTMPFVLCIAGADSSHGAGVQRDGMLLDKLGVFGISLITALTVQTKDKVTDIFYTNPTFFKNGLEKLLSNYMPAVIKIGMLGKSENIEVIVKRLQQYSQPIQIILDPIFYASFGQALFSSMSLQHYQKSLMSLFPFVDVLTPNIPEAEILLARKIKSHEEIMQAAQDLSILGIKNVYIKGGHGEFSSKFSHDYFYSREAAFWLTSKKYKQQNYRGTGCVFSSALAAFLAQKHSLADAVVLAKMVVNRAIRKSEAITEKTSFLFCGGMPDEGSDLPFISTAPIIEMPTSFKSLLNEKLGLYPIVSTADDVKKILTLGARTIQLRIKDQSGTMLEQEIETAINEAKKWQAKLFINDHWQLALKYKAYGVHVGQTDLETTDFAFIRESHLALGISTHGFAELARAHAFFPSYVALGPIFPTNTKIMSYAPQGIARLAHFQKIVGDLYPLVAIGGINAKNIAAVRETKVSGIAMISAIPDFFG